MIRRLLYGAAMTLLVASAAPGQSPPQVEKNIIFGMYSGAALLMDIYRPFKSTGWGRVLTRGSGWYMPQRYDVPGLKEDGFITAYGRRFAEAGYTAFVINHRAAP